MPDTAILIAPVDCPACGTRSHMTNHLQWGVCPRQAPYNVGDEVEWLRLPSGEIVTPFRLFHWAWNCGDPMLLDLLLIDPSFQGGPLQCAQCAATFEGVVVEVQGGRFRSARFYTSGEFSDDVNTFEKLPDGTFKPHPEWFDCGIFPFEQGG